MSTDSARADCDLSLDSLLSLSRMGTANETLSAAGGPALVSVDLTETSPDARTHTIEPSDIAAISGLACVVAGVHLPGAVVPASQAQLMDVLVTSAQLDGLRETVARNPIASVSLALLLRHSEARTIDDGLAAESAVYSLLQSGPEFARWRNSRTAKHRPTPPGDPVLWQRFGDEVHIALYRPHVHNAFNAALRDGLVEVLTFCVADPSVERVLLTGAGPSFCSGGDLDEFGSFPDPANAHLIRLTRSVGRLITRIRERIGPGMEVRLHGACMGAGIELPAFAGTITAHPGAAIALPEIALGLIPGAGGTVSMPRRIGRHRTAYLGLTGARIDARTALEWGLIDRIEETDGDGEGTGGDGTEGDGTEGAAVVRSPA